MNQARASPVGIGILLRNSKWTSPFRPKRVNISPSKIRAMIAAIFIEVSWNSEKQDEQQYRQRCPPFAERCKEFVVW
jgi:hypothetical protein